MVVKIDIMPCMSEASTINHAKQVDVSPNLDDFKLDTSQKI